MLTEIMSTTNPPRLSTSFAPSMKVFVLGVGLALIYFFYRNVGVGLIESKWPPFAKLEAVEVTVVQYGPYLASYDVQFVLYKPVDRGCTYKRPVFQAIDKEGYKNDIGVDAGDNGDPYTRSEGQHKPNPWRLYGVPMDAVSVEGFIEHQCWWNPRRTQTAIQPFLLPQPNTGG